jgi:hypothetical protein
MKTNIYRMLAIVLSLAALTFVGVSASTAQSDGGGQQQASGCGC